ncbi:MAG: hypothetical protein ACLSD3_12685, partial [Acutalibacteraceae bacterium]
MTARRRVIFLESRVLAAMRSACVCALGGGTLGGAQGALAGGGENPAKKAVNPWVHGFLERTTRLELATSTLARW